MLVKTELMLMGVAIASIVILATKAGRVAIDAAGAVGHAVNPLNNDNVFAQASNRVTQILTGDDSQTLGGWIYDATHFDFPELATGPASSPNPLGQGAYGQVGQDGVNNDQTFNWNF